MNTKNIPVLEKTKLSNTPKQEAGCCASTQTTNETSCCSVSEETPSDRATSCCAPETKNTPGCC